MAHEKDLETDLIFDEEEDLTEEQKVQLSQGVKKVEEILGNSKDISKEVIEDTLWYYYFDVNQTVDYLREKYNSGKEFSDSREQDESKSGSLDGANSVSIEPTETCFPSTTSEKAASQSIPLASIQSKSPTKLNTLTTTSIGKPTEASSKLSLEDITSRLSLKSSSLSSAMKPLPSSIPRNDKPLLALSSSSLSKSNITTNLSAKSSSLSNITKLPGMDSKIKPLAPLPSTLSRNKTNSLAGPQPLSNTIKHSSTISLGSLSGRSRQDDSKDRTHRSIISSALNALSHLPSTGDGPSKKTLPNFSSSKAAPVKPLSSLHISKIPSPNTTLKSLRVAPNTPRPENPGFLSRSSPVSSSEFSPVSITPVDVPLNKINLVAPPSVFAISVFEKLDKGLQGIPCSDMEDSKFFYSMQSEHLPKYVTPFKFDLPSPDDIVLAAQSHRSGGKLEAK